MKAYFRAVAAAFNHPTPAQAAAGVSLLALNLYTGYNIPERDMTPALRWIAHINVCVHFCAYNAVRLAVYSLPQPLKYSYEAIMTNEFRTLNLRCSNLVPQGPGYETITLENQVCAVVGSVPGQTTVSGLRYLALSFDYEWSHMWRVGSSHLFVSSSLHPRRTLASFSRLAPASLRRTSPSPSLDPSSQRLAPFSHSSVELRRSGPLNADLMTWRPPLLLPQTPSTIFTLMTGKLRKIWQQRRR